ncbi:hypothetical protein [Anoxybacillus gonensis]|uniref:fluoroquinolone export ABC transporter permease subunit n=1 Tax=Anoxybacillus gonensis TaxID=198467 RepID=UPI0002BDB3BA|nr:hypothetical protein [Anoxybacillus gonensis]EMI11470.1 ABC-2 type transporter [Anoxybacillus gonensis]
MIWSMIKQDIRFQARHGFYIVYGFVSLFYIAALRWMPINAREYIAPVVVLMDPAAVGFFMAGAVILLERSQGVLDPLFITPLRLRHYIWAKAWTLAFLGFLSGVAVIVSSLDIAQMTLLKMVGLYAIAVIMALFGVALAVRTKSVNTFLLQASLVMVVLLLPLLSYFRLSTIPFVFLPTDAALNVLAHGESLSWQKKGIVAINLFSWMMIAYKIAKKACERYLMQVGGEK